MLRLAYLAPSASGNVPNLMWVALGGALRDFRRNWVFIQTRKAFEWGRSVDLIVAYLRHLKGQSDEETGKDHVVSAESVCSFTSVFPKTLCLEAIPPFPKLQR